jgi:peptidyl-prolyl cis-trans isomerase B (cyclophilin B)
MHRVQRALMVVLCVAGLAAGQSPALPEAAQVRELRRAMLAAEDSRPVTRDQARPLLTGLSSALPAIQRAAVRGLGRLEDPQFAADVVPLLEAGSPGVRTEAVNALGQMATKQADLATDLLLKRMEIEKDDVVRGVLGETLGRLPFVKMSDMQRVEAVLVDLARSVRSATVQVGVVKGLEALMRRGWSKQFRAQPATISYLQHAAEAAPGVAFLDEDARVRRLAMLALAAGRNLADVHVRALDDADPQVRRLAVVALLLDVPFDRRAAMVERALKDADAMVRYEAVRVHGRHLAKTSCAVEIAALEDPNPHVRLVAIDQLGTPAHCPAEAPSTTALVALAKQLGAEPAPAPAVGARQGSAGTERGRESVSSPSSAAQDWRAPAHAIVSLARRAPAETVALLPIFAAHRVWQVRMYAARAADALGDAGTLTTLSADENANVREIALAALVRVKGHDADSVLLNALGRPSFQVVLQVARGLKGTPRRAEATRELLTALAALTASGFETSRDPRLAILERVQELGDPKRSADLEPYVTDFDPAVASRAAEILTVWTGQRRDASPRRGAPAPTPEDVDALPPGIRVTMAGGRSFDVRFDLDQAPTTAFRIVRLVNAGYFNGLTFHRIVPGFIIQGGSPDANEFVGDGPFIRDELGLSTNARGTVGSSTRGRDTGDAQFYVNTVDNPRLDHDYTVFGAITRGMAVVDAILEGDVIVRVEVLLK